MSGSAPRGRRRRTRKPSAGLLTAWRRLPLMPDPDGLSAISGKNRADLRLLAKLVHCLCDGTPGTVFFLGSVSAGMLLGRPHQTVQRWLLALQRQQVIARVWRGRPCRKGTDGKPLAAGLKVDRASEFKYLGLPAVRAGKCAPVSFNVARPDAHPAPRSSRPRVVPGDAERRRVSADAT